MRYSPSTCFGMMAAVLALGMPGIAHACRLGPLPSDVQRVADIQQRQVEAWDRSPLVYLAAVTEVSPHLRDDLPFGNVRIALTAVAVLKGRERPGDFDVVYPELDRRCGRDFLDIAAGAQVDDLFLVYASTTEPDSADDIWSQAWVEVRDPVAIRAAAEHGWDQTDGQNDRRPTED
jgi:hypothetical protein